MLSLIRSKSSVTVGLCAVMEEEMWSMASNSTDGDNASFSATAALPRIAGRRLMQLGVHLTIGFGVSVIGSLANALVLVVLLLARRKYGNGVNTLIINQSAMDLFFCASVVAIYTVIFARGLSYGSNQIANTIFCVVVEGGVFAAFGLTAGELGLVVITLERYFKIVHAIAHRRYYRAWMTKVGVALPWIGAACLTLFPAMGTSRIVNGRCQRLGVWPMEGMAKVRKD